ncbi:thiamine biosynthesis protein ApbE [Chryseobacterium sp. Leaf180]|uniref:FAD:protein FMN transferase n=1 Tax=Chryseobacterium sp. Leaf180 TaxID=1736289 RepID=UPI0006F33E5E|nr:FAD:protein FMN transferase [Chryseobacterium sp. Leaf180]KQR94826.1 thiamine biosynthesis protein ApbE [Chryseobacterium sp. Leaf180]
MRIFSFKIITILFTCIAVLSFSQVQKSRAVTLMGSRFDITVVDSHEGKADKSIDLAIKEISRIEDLISEWKPETEISKVNKNAGIKSVKVSAEVLNLTEKALYFSEITDGAFDISIAALDKIWKFDDSMNEIPADSLIRKSIEKVGYQNIIIDRKNSTVFLKKPGMKIGFGSIGKGYAADAARELLKKNGVKGGIINASGDLSTWGNQADGSLWTIGINNPFKENIAEVLQFKEYSVTTSGSYEKFAEINGIRYSHIINPKTGMPSTGLTSVTVIGKDATSANGFSTSVMVLGKKKGIKLINNFPEFQYLLITDKGKIIKSKNFKNIYP